MAEVFSDAVTPVNPLETLVGEGKKFKTVEDLAKSKLESDNFIATLTTETAGYKEEIARLTAEVNARKTVEDQIKALNANKVVPPANSGTPEHKPQGQVITDEDLTKRVKAITESETQASVARANLSTVIEQLVKVYGSEEKANAALQAKAQELKVSTKFLESAAAQSPQAFFSLIGMTSVNVTPHAPRSEVNGGFGDTRQVNQPAPGTYEDMRNKQGRLDVKKLVDPKYLNETMRLALADPDKFLGSAA